MGEDWSIWEQALPDDEFFHHPPAYIEGFGMVKEDLSIVKYRRGLSPLGDRGSPVPSF